MKFEWDDFKNWDNIQKHGIPFDYAMLVYEDEYRLEEYDYNHDEDEDRYNVIGMIDRLLFVVVTYRDEDTVRIISARPATKAEKVRYEKWLLLQ